jgi:hypothetical protein
MAENYSVQFGNVFGNIFGDSFTITFAPVAAGPGLVFVGGSSNGQGVGVAANMTDFPGISTPFAGFQFSRTGALFNANPTFISEAKQDLQPRTANLGGSYPVGTCGPELTMGRDLDAANTGLWGGATFTVDGSRIDPALEWLNPGWPTTPPSGMDRLFAAIDAAIVAHGKPLKAFIWDHGNDGNVAQGANYYNNLISFFTRLRVRYGDIGIVLPILTNKNTGGGLMQTVRAHMEAWAMLPSSDRVRTVYLDDLGMRDAAHYADDAGGVKGYGEAGKRYATAVISAVNETVDNTIPKWGAQGVVVTATSLGLPAVPLPLHFGTYNNKPDIGVLWYSGASANPITAPAGWTQVTNSPFFGGAVADARLHVFTRTLVAGDTAPTIADVASDEAKMAGIFIIRNSSGLDTNAPTGDTVAAAAPSAVVTWPTYTTVTNKCLVVQLLAYRIDDVVPKVSGYTNAALTGLEERVDIDSNVGSGYGFAACIGVDTVAGAIGTTTATLAAACSQARCTLAFKP